MSGQSQVNSLPVGVLVYAGHAPRQEDLSFGNCFTPCSGIAQVRCYSHPKAAVMSGEDLNASYFSILHSFCVFVGTLLTEQTEEFTLRIP